MWRQNLKKYFNDYIVLFSIAGGIVLLDQITKRIIESNLAYGEVFRPDFWLSQYVRLVNWHNTGAAFGLFQNMNPVFTVLAFIVAGVIIFYDPHVPRHEWALRLAMCLQLGGATGNLVDRLRQGFVTDFVSVGNFPVFNVADSSISIGVVVLFLGLWISERNLAQAKQSSEPAQTEALTILAGEGIMPVDDGIMPQEDDPMPADDGIFPQEDDDNMLPDDFSYTPTDAELGDEWRKDEEANE